MNATNPALIESAVGTPGYGASSAGLGGGAGSTLPSWLTNGVKNFGTRTAIQAGLGALTGAAALGQDGVSTADRQGVANTLGSIGNEQLGIARDLYTGAKDRITANDDLFSQIITNALTQQQQQGQRSDKLWDTYLADFLPNTQKFAQTALNYDTAGRRSEAGAAARAAVETEGAMQRQAQQRQLGRAGVNLTSGRALTLDNASRLNQTKLSTGAEADARRKVEETGLMLNGQAANLGQGIVGTSQQQAGQALTAGNTATGALATKESTRNATLAPTQSFYSGATGALGSSGNVLNGVAATESQNQASRNAGLAGLGSLAGTILTSGKDSIIGDLFGLSDPKSKTVHGKVSGRRALADLEEQPVSSWTYKPGMGDEGTHVGRMAGEGDPMGSDGLRRIDIVSELGKQHAAIVELGRQVKALKPGRRSLADMEA